MGVFFNVGHSMMTRTNVPVLYLFDSDDLVFVILAVVMATLIVCSSTRTSRVDKHNLGCISTLHYIYIASY